MPELLTIKKLADELKFIREDIGFIKKHMFDPDSIMTTEEVRIFKQSMKELNEGKTTSLKSLKKEMGL